MNPKPMKYCCSSEVKIGNLLVRRWPVDHSIPGAGAFGIRTSEGWIIYTGDLRLHGRRGPDTVAFVEEASSLEPLALICEGTHPGTERPVTEEEVFHNSLEVIRRARGLVIADFGPRNIERLLSFLRIARETGRLLAITTKDAYLLEALSIAGEPEVPNPKEDENLVIYVEAKGSRQTWEKTLLEQYSNYYPDKLVTSRMVNKYQNEYILCFSYYDLNELIDIQPSGGIYLYSSSEAFNEEMHMDLDRLRCWLSHFHLKLVGNPGDREGKGKEPGFHASGHIHGPGLVGLVEKLRPEFLIPVHCEDIEFFTQNLDDMTKIVAPEPGVTVELFPGRFNLLHPCSQQVPA